MLQLRFFSVASRVATKVIFLVASDVKIKNFSLTNGVAVELFSQL
jgi:hypothetical protein